MSKEKTVPDNTEQAEREKLERGTGTKDSTVSGAKAKKKGNLVYLGPTITGAIRHGTTFKDGELPENARNRLKEFPAMERLLVEVDKMSGAVIELQKRQSTLKTVYKQTEEYFNMQELKRRN